MERSNLFSKMGAERYRMHESFVRDTLKESWRIMWFVHLGVKEVRIGSYIVNLKPSQIGQYFRYQFAKFRHQFAF